MLFMILTTVVSSVDPQKLMASIPEVFLAIYCVNSLGFINPNMALDILRKSTRRGSRKGMIFEGVGMSRCTDVVMMLENSIRRLSV